MSNLMDTLFGPMSQSQCMFFYILMIFLFVRFILVLITGIVVGLKNGRNAMFYITVLGASLTDFILYYICRILYSMCIKSM